MIETNRCRMIELQKSDYDDISEIFFDSQVRKYLGGTIEESQYLIKFKKMLEAGNEEWYWVIRNKESMELVGLISLDQHHDGVSTEISYQLLPKWWGNGYAKETVKKLLDYAFASLKMRKVVAETQSANIASCKLLESIGMALEYKIIRFEAEQSVYAVTYNDIKLRAEES